MQLIVLAAKVCSRVKRRAPGRTDQRPDEDAACRTRGRSCRQPKVPSILHLKVLNTWNEPIERCPNFRLDGLLSQCTITESSKGFKSHLILHQNFKTNYTTALAHSSGVILRQITCLSAAQTACETRREGRSSAKADRRTTSFSRIRVYVSLSVLRLQSLATDLCSLCHSISTAALPIPRLLIRLCIRSTNPHLSLCDSTRDYSSPATI